MIAARFQVESSAEPNQFSFFNPKSSASHGRRSLDSVDYAVWAQRMRGAWSRRASFGGRRRGRKHEGDGGINWSAGAEEEEERDDSGTPSPPLWKGGSPRSSPRHPLMDEQAAGVTARGQEIARFQQELLERARGLEEADYELSLRDLVQLPALSPEKREKEVGPSMGKKSGGGKIGGALRSERTASGGFLLKMLSFPISVGERRRREGVIGEDRGGGGRGRRRELGGIGSSSSSSSTSSSSRSSSSSNSSRNSSSRIKRMSSCYSFFGKNKEIELEI